MLERGTIDAICTERAPDSFFSALDKVGRLFADSMAAERDYFQRSGIYPPMHLICVKRRFVEANPPPPRRALLEAFAESQSQAKPRLHDSATLAVGMPWLVQHLEETKRLVGANFWATGFAANRVTMATLIRYLLAEGC